ncbi:hypothetical protein AB0N87_29285 [Streptomyces sp. NPDC093228]|uniref:hypothetical protein n=1 Tax=Streptomyces sp. NPDC093228 TaxID=3155070 RepID=UPI003420B469
MRIRATAAVAVVCGVAAMTGAAIPAAQAAGTLGGTRPWQLAGHNTPATGKSAFTAAAATAKTPYPLAVTFSNVKVAGGKSAVTVGTSAIVHVPYSFTLTATNVDISASDFVVGLDLYHGSVAAPSADLYGDRPATCSVTSSMSSSEKVVTVETCKGTVDIYPKYDLANSDAGTSWHSVAWAVAYNGQNPGKPSDISKIGAASLTGQRSPAVQRLSRLTVNAAPEPVKKGRTLTITGSLTRANWESHKYAGYTGQKVKLQFRKKGSSTYTTLKTLTTDGHGNLRTTYKATTDGYWRYSFAGTSTTPAISAAGDYVDVK